jgi:hypothetical protein
VKDLETAILSNSNIADTTLLKQMMLAYDEKTNALELIYNLLSLALFYHDIAVSDLPAGEVHLIVVQSLRNAVNDKNKMIHFNR